MGQSGRDNNGTRRWFRRNDLDAERQGSGNYERLRDLEDGLEGLGSICEELQKESMYRMWQEQYLKRYIGKVSYLFLFPNL